MSLATIPIDPGYTLLIGVLFGLAAVRNRTRALWAGLIACALFGIAIPAYCYWKFPAWMWMYSIDPATVPLWFLVYVFGLYFIPFLAGFAFTPRRHGWILLVVVALLNGALLLAVRERYNLVGTYAEFHRGAAQPLLGSRLSTVLNICFPLSVAGMAALWFWARRGIPKTSTRISRKEAPILLEQQ